MGRQQPRAVDHRMARRLAAVRWGEFSANWALRLTNVSVVSLPRACADWLVEDLRDQRPIALRRRLRPHRPFHGAVAVGVMHNSSGALGRPLTSVCNMSNPS